MGALESEQHELYSRLSLERLEPSASGLYECEVLATGEQQPQQQQQQLLSSHLQLDSRAPPPPANSGADRLRRLFGLHVQGK